MLELNKSYTREEFFKIINFETKSKDKGVKLFNYYKRKLREFYIIKDEDKYLTIEGFKYPANNLTELLRVYEKTGTFPSLYGMRSLFMILKTNSINTKTFPACPYTKTIHFPYSKETISKLCEVPTNASIALFIKLSLVYKGRPFKIQLKNFGFWNKQNRDREFRPLRQLGLVDAEFLPKEDCHIIRSLAL